MKAGAWRAMFRTPVFDTCVGKILPGQEARGFIYFAILVEAASCRQ